MLGVLHHLGCRALLPFGDKVKVVPGDIDVLPALGPQKGVGLEPPPAGGRKEAVRAWAMSEPSTPAVQMTAPAGSVHSLSPVLKEMASGPTPVTLVRRKSWQPIFFSRFSTLADSFSGSTGTARSSRSAQIRRGSSPFMPNSRQRKGMYSASSPAISAPVKPAPTTQKVRMRRRLSASGMPAACRKQARTLSRIRRASS